MKILVCDDDISTVDVLEKQIDYKELGIDVFLKAFNGLEAKEIIAKEKPELVLCDIGMPGEDGMEVLKYIYENHIDNEFAFLTCYEDFEYAKKALQYGASDYINKPFEIEEIIIAIQKMLASYARKHESKKDRNSLVSSVFKQIGDGAFSTKEEIQSVLKENHIEISTDSEWRIVFTCADMTEAIQKTWSTELLYYECEEIHHRILLKNRKYASSNAYMDSKYIWNISVFPADCDEESLLEKLEELEKYLKDSMSLQPVILLMNPFAFTDLPGKLTDAYTIIRRIRTNHNRIYFEGEAKEYLETEHKSFDENRVLWFVKERDCKGYTEYMSKAIFEIEGNPGVLSQSQKELINIFLTVLKDNGLASGMLFEKDEIKECDKKACGSNTGLMKYAEILMKKFSELAYEIVDSDDVITRAKKYIDENFRDNIDREDVAAHAFVTPNYLSKQFRIRMNTNMREYINKLRIDEAERLLLTTNMPVSEIASYVGYDNISYFSTVFRKITGKSPTDWRS